MNYYLWSWGHKTREQAEIDLQGDCADQLVGAKEASNARIRRYKGKDGVLKYAVELPDE